MPCEIGDSRSLGCSLGENLEVAVAYVVDVVIAHSLTLHQAHDALVGGFESRIFASGEYEQRSTRRVGVGEVEFLVWRPVALLYKLCLHRRQHLGMIHRERIAGHRINERVEALAASDFEDAVEHFVGNRVEVAIGAGEAVPQRGAGHHHHRNFYIHLLEKRHHCGGSARGSHCKHDIVGLDKVVEHRCSLLRHFAVVVEQSAVEVAYE